MTTPTDWRKLCAQFVDASALRAIADRVVPEERQWSSDHRGDEWIRWKERQRIRRKLLEVAEEAERSSDEELLRIWQFNFARTDKERFMDIAHAVLAHYGRPVPQPQQEPSKEDLYMLMNEFTTSTGHGERLDEIGFARAVLARYGRTAPVPVAEPFIVRHYTGDTHPTIKGNGFDGLVVGKDREEAEEFVSWLNARLSLPEVQP